MLIGHDPTEIVAWCADLEFCDGQLIACAQFPPKGVSRKADRAFEAVRNGELPCTSIGYSALRAAERRRRRDGGDALGLARVFFHEEGRKHGAVACFRSAAAAGARKILVSRRPITLGDESPAHYVCRASQYRGASASAACA